MEIKLTKKEEELIQLKADGYTNEQISKKVFMSHKSVNNMFTTLFLKTGSTNGSSLVKWGFEHGVLKINTQNSPSKANSAA